VNTAKEKIMTKCKESNFNLIIIISKTAQTIQACSVFTGIGLTIFYLVDPNFIYISE